MTDTTPTTAPPKKMWTRCNGCQQRIFNEPLDIKIHAPLCPQNMLLALQKLNLTVFGDKRVAGSTDEALVTRLSGLEDVIGNLDEHTPEPALDPDGIDEDAYTDVVGDQTVSAETPTDDEYADALPSIPATYPPAIDRDEPDPFTGTRFSG